MTRFQFVFLTGLFITLLGCGRGRLSEEVVTFQEPQPIETENLRDFPNRLRGRYLEITDSSILVIGEKLIQRIYDFDQKLAFSELDSNSKISGDTLIDLRNNKRIAIKVVGDSVITHIHFVDTVFEMNYDNVVRKYKGHYFLNKRVDKAAWNVRMLDFSKGELMISAITQKESIDNLKEITESKQDTVIPYRISASRKQFKDFVDNNGFSTVEFFVRIR